MHVEETEEGRGLVREDCPRSELHLLGELPEVLLRKMMVADSSFRHPVSFSLPHRSSCCSILVSEAQGNGSQSRSHPSKGRSLLCCDGGGWGIC